MSVWPIGPPAAGERVKGRTNGEGRRGGKRVRKKRLGWGEGEMEEKIDKEDKGGKRRENGE